jgi:hypothetical protein
MALPDRIPIAYMPEYRSWCIGHYADGQFLGLLTSAPAKGHRLGDDRPELRRVYSVLHLFDHEGRYRSSDIWYAGTGQGAAFERALARLNERVNALPGREYGDIAIRLFRVDVEAEGLVFELVDESDEERGDWAELYPNHWGFPPPWDGRYDT